MIGCNECEYERTCDQTLKACRSNAGGKRKKKICYIVKWGNGFVGGFDENCEQLWNGSEESLVDDLAFYHIDEVKIISQKELDEIRGYHKPTIEEYLSETK